MKTQATAKFVGTSARKTGLIAGLIRGRRALDARNILAHTDKRATVPVGKVLESAIANAENNHNAKAADLMIESVLIGPGPTLKRSRARGKGSSAAIRKRSSHITIVVTDGKAATTLRGKVAEAEVNDSAKASAGSKTGAADTKTGKTAAKNEAAAKDAKKEAK